MLDLKPNFEIDHTAFLNYGGNIKQVRVTKINIQVTQKTNSRPTGIRISYNVIIGAGSSREVSEDELFKTRAGCAMNWLKKQNLNAPEVMQAYLHEVKEMS